MNKTTLSGRALAPSNLAFVKYWGKSNAELRLPSSASLSMNLSELYTETEVEFLTNHDPSLEDHLEINGETMAKNSTPTRRVSQHLDRIWKLKYSKPRPSARIISNNSFPTSTGLSSSASGFAALTLAACDALNLKLPQDELAKLARLGSGSACRSIPDGFVLWEAANSQPSKEQTEKTIRSLFPKNHWPELRVISVVISDEKKKRATSNAHALAETSPFFERRLTGIPQKIQVCQNALEQRDFKTLGELAEQEALEMHACMMTCTPSLLYWSPDTLKLMKSVQDWRSEGLAVYFSLNTGQNIYLICEAEQLTEIETRLKALSEVEQYFVSQAAAGAHLK